MGEWRGNLFKVDLTPTKIQTTKFGDAVILNTGIPLWYSGGEITEMSVLEQPEIRDVNTASGDTFRRWVHRSPFHGSRPVVAVSDHSRVC